MTTAVVMPAGHAEWIRGHAWTPKMRKTYAEVPGAYTACACEYGTTSHCQGGRHDQCHRAIPMPVHEGFVCGPTGVEVLAFKAPYQHPTETAVGRRCGFEAHVWLADRVCRWQCPCGCHQAPPLAVQLDLFPLDRPERTIRERF